jgi:predicted TIM-barrel enzyme
MTSFFAEAPWVIAALHLPPFTPGKLPSMALLEDYALQNLAVFAAGGIPAVILQDETLNAGRARPEVLTMMSSLGRLARTEFPQVELGIIIEAHDPVASLAVAQACGASFVRLKVFVGAMLKSPGVQQGCGIEAVEYRISLGRPDIRILADVHDRTGKSLLDIPIPQAAHWAANTGADALVLTGSSFLESLEFVADVQRANVKKPLLIGGSVDAGNVARALSQADGVIVSSSLKRQDAGDGGLVLWDLDRVTRFMDAAREKAR